LKDFPCHDFFDIADELIFYHLIEFMNIYEEAGFISPCMTSARQKQDAGSGAYDLSGV
jgi:hypothetical protein